MRFRYAAIKRHNNRTWHAAQGGDYIEFNPNYVVNVASIDDYELLHNDEDTPYIVELSNGTRFLTYLHGPAIQTADAVVSDSGEAANLQSADENYSDNHAIRTLAL